MSDIGREFDEFVATLFATNFLFINQVQFKLVLLLKLITSLKALLLIIWWFINVNVGKKAKFIAKSAKRYSGGCDSTTQLISTGLDNFRVNF